MNLIMMVLMVITTTALLAGLCIVTLESGEVLRIGSRMLLLLLLHILLLDTGAAISAEDINHLYTCISILKRGLIAIQLSDRRNCLTA